MRREGSVPGVTLLRVSEKLWRSSEPTTEEDFEQIKKAGIGSILSLQGNIVELLGAEVQRELWLFGKKVYWLPFSSVFPPARKRVMSGIALVQWNVEPTLVHCKEGVDRTGFFVAAYRMRIMGWSYDDAKNEMIALGSNPYYRLWFPFLRSYLTP